MNYPPQEQHNMSITHCQIDRSSDTCTPHEHESLSAFIEKVEASGEDRKHEAALLLEAIGPDKRVMRFYANGHTEGFPEGTMIINRALPLLNAMEAKQVTLMQAITDPENQPSQFGTVTVEFMKAAVRAERERCAAINEAKAMKMEEEAQWALSEGDKEACTGCRATAWVLKVCAIDMQRPDEPKDHP